MKFLFTALVFMHGLLHLVGFVKAYFSPDVFSEILVISKPLGLLWFLVAALFIHTSSLLYKTKNKGWIYGAFIAVILSQYLIYMSWKDTRLGSIFNVIILLIAFLDAINKLPYKVKYTNR